MLLSHRARQRLGELTLLKYDSTRKEPNVLIGSLTTTLCHAPPKKLRCDMNTVIFVPSETLVQQRRTSHCTHTVLVQTVCLATGWVGGGVGRVMTLCSLSAAAMFAWEC